MAGRIRGRSEQTGAVILGSCGGLLHGRNCWHDGSQRSYGSGLQMCKRRLSTGRSAVRNCSGGRGGRGARWRPSRCAAQSQHFRCVALLMNDRTATCTSSANRRHGRERARVRSGTKGALRIAVADGSHAVRVCVCVPRRRCEGGDGGAELAAAASRLDDDSESAGRLMSSGERGERRDWRRESQSGGQCSAVQ